MFCSSCGNQLPDEAVFCTKCGSKQSGSQEKNTPQSQGYTAPQPFQQYSTIDPHQPIYQKQAFAGKQASVGSSGHVSFGNNSTGKKSGGCLKVFLVGILVLFLIAALGIGAILLFGSSEGISNVRIASQIDSVTNQPITLTNTFTPQSPIIYCTLNSKNEIGTLVSVEWWYTTDNILITSYSINAETDDDQFSFSLSRPDNGWPTGSYEVKVYVNDKYATSAKFKVE